MKAGLIVNPRSGKSSGKGVALADKLLHNTDVFVKVLDRFEQLPDFINDCASKGVTHLFISSGDGTIQAIQTELAERQPFAQLPTLGLLPHGTTNMTAADLGFRLKSIDAQANFIAHLNPTDLRRRPTLRAANPKDGRPRHGMFLGAGAVTHATRFCQEAFNAKGVKGSWATFATLASAVGRAVFTKPDPTDLTRLDRPHALSVEADGKPVCEGQQLLVLATTLQKLILGTKPFWGGGAAPIRTSVFPYPVPSVVRWLLPIMYGGENRRAPPGASSVAASVLRIATSSGFVIDGEFFDPPDGEPLRIETGPVFTYVCS